MKGPQLNFKLKSLSLSTCIPHICPFWYTTIHFRPVKSTPTKCVNLKQNFLEKSTPPPVVRWWTNIRYGHTGLKKIARHCRNDSRVPKTQLTHVRMKIFNFSHFSWAIFKKSCFFLFFVLFSLSQTTFFKVYGVSMGFFYEN